MVLLQVFFEVVNSGFSWFVHDMLPDLALCFSTTRLLSFGVNRFHPGSIRAPVTLFHQISVYFARVNVDLCRYTFILKNDFIHKTQDFSANFLSVFWAAILPSLQDERYTIPSITHHKNHQPIRVWDLSDL